MPPVDLRTRIDQFKPILAANSTAASFASKIITATEPTGDGIVDVILSGTVEGPANVLIVPFGRDAANETFDFRVIGWHWIDTSGDDLWMPTTLLEATATLGTGTGVAGHAVLSDSELIADTIDVTGGLGARDKYSPANNTIAWVSCDLMGAQKLEISGDLTGAAQMNWLYKLL